MTLTTIWTTMETLKNSTLKLHKVVIRAFIGKINPKLAGCIKTKNIQHSSITPDQLLTYEEIDCLIRRAPTARDKALIACLTDSGARKGELLSTTISDAKFDEYGCLLWLREGKTGPRPARLIFASSYLRQWLEIHPRKEDPDAPIFCSFTGRSLKVNQRLQLWNDTKNGTGGNVLDWIGRGFSNPRGSDFPKVIRIAAEIARVELAELTEKELEAEKEKIEIHNLFSETVDIYHNNLTEKPKLYDYIMENWSITQETVNLLKIGYATMGRYLNGLDEVTLQKSGLVFVNDSKVGGEVFNGRIIFPY